MLALPRSTESDCRVIDYEFLHVLSDRRRQIVPATVDLAAQGQAPPPFAASAAFLDILASQEDTRKRIAYVLDALLAIVVLASTATIFIAAIDVSRVKDVLDIFLRPSNGLVGTVIGFYFGARTAQEAR